HTAAVQSPSPSSPSKLPYIQYLPTAKGPLTKRQERQRKLRQNLYNRRFFVSVQSAYGEEWYDADT
ncbi:MAG: hypothetical protein ACKPKO_57730, partial [Candidatus Fonsibacter sp.]